MATLHNPDWRDSPTMPRAAPSRALEPRVWAAVFLGYLMLAPPQLNLFVAGSSLPPYRIFLIGSSLFVPYSIIRGGLRIVWADILMALAVAWICFAMWMNSTASAALTASMAHIADIGFAYFFARSTIRSVRDLRALLFLVLPGLLVVGILMAIESITHTHIIQPFFASVTGKSFSYYGDPRLGLLRAQGPFPHPILAGIFLSTFACMYWLSGLHKVPRMLGMIAAALSFFTVSSATLLALVASTALLAYDGLAERISNLSWKMFFAFAALFVFATELGTNSGSFRLIVRYASLNAAAGGNRVNIWEYGSQSVANHPWFGIGYADWERPIWMGDSVDNFWLLTAMRYGLPAVILIALAVILAVVGLARKSTQSDFADARTERGLAMAISVYSLTLMSVALWLSAQTWFFVLIGIAVSLAVAPMSRPALNRSAMVVAPPRPVSSHPTGSVRPRSS